MTYKKHCQHLTIFHNHLKVAALRSPITHAKIPACKGIDGRSYLELVALVDLHWFAVRLSQPPLGFLQSLGHHAVDVQHLE